MQKSMDRTLSSWEDVRYFLSVLRSGSFSGAARELSTEQSTVSRRIAALEESLGHKLFERGPRTVLPTMFAKQLQDTAFEVERAMFALQDTARSKEEVVQGRVRLALTEGLAQHVVIPLVLPKLLQAHPALSIDLQTSDDAVHLERQEADVALRFFRTPRGALVGQRVAKLELGILVAKTEVKRFRGLSLRELPWVGYVHPRITFSETQWLEQLGVTRPRIECSSVETQLAAVRAGLGVALGSKVLLRVFPELCLLERKETPPIAPLEVFVVTRAAIRKTPRIAAVYEALVEGLQAL